MFRDFGFRITGKLIRCDIDAQQIQLHRQPDIALVGDARITARKLKERLQHSNGASRNISGDNVINGSGASRTRQTLESAMAEFTQEAHAHLQLLQTIQQTLTEPVIVGDSTQLIYSGNMIHNTDAPNLWFNSSVGFGTLGYALPAAIGASIARQSDARTNDSSSKTPVVCLIGDGGLQFVLGELGTLKDNQAPVAIIVWCNNGYREIKTSMENAGVSTVGVELAVPDFTAVAEAYGITGVRINSDTTLCETLVNAYKRNESILIELDENRMMS